MSNLSYIKYINSPIWENKKTEIKDIYLKNNWSISCVRCGNSSNLNLHHNYYSFDLENTNVSDFDYLCSTCHEDWHRNRKIGGYYIEQNLVVGRNFDFYIKDKDFLGKKQFTNLLSLKIEEDEGCLLDFFYTNEVIEYEAYKKADDFRSRLLVYSFLLAIVYGIGIVTGILTLIFVKERREVQKPEMYDSFSERRRLLEKKKIILGVVLHNINSKAQLLVN